MGVTDYLLNSKFWWLSDDPEFQRAVLRSVEEPMVAVRVEEPEILTLQEAAEYLRIHPSTVYKILKRKNPPPHFKTGSDHRFHRPSLDKWINDQAMRFFERSSNASPSKDV